MSYRRNRGGGGRSNTSTGWLGFIAIVFGTVALLICLIMFGIGLDTLDTAYTSAATYTEQVGLTSVMGIWPLILFIIFMAAGLAAVGAGSYVNVKKALTGGWMDIFMVVIMGTVSLVISLLMNTTIQSQLHTAYVDASNVSKTANIASFSGLLSVMTIWGMVIFLALMASGLSQLIGAAYGSYKHLAGKM